ncbi:hypothetical protein, partial [Leptolyngbya sp. CCY15150]|uniref:hypothetical protein n=1 Tax=Leptolyngbya sp. CCY15150 TaxID=2767772 RepID=UPI001EF22096
QAIHHGGVEQTQRNGIKHHQKLGRAQDNCHLTAGGRTLWRQRQSVPSGLNLICSRRRVPISEEG